MQQVKVKIAADGSLTVEAEGVTGKGCEALTKPMEDALGATGGRTHKPEYHQEQQQSAQEGQY